MCCPLGSLLARHCHEGGPPLKLCMPLRDGTARAGDGRVGDSGDTRKTHPRGKPRGAAFTKCYVCSGCLRLCSDGRYPHAHSVPVRAGFLLPSPFYSRWGCRWPRHARCRKAVTLGRWAECALLDRMSWLLVFEEQALFPAMSGSAGIPTDSFLSQMTSYLQSLGFPGESVWNHEFILRFAFHGLLLVWFWLCHSLLR